MNRFKIDDIYICKKGFTYNLSFNTYDKFKVVKFNEYNVRLLSEKNTYHNIAYSYDSYLYFYDLFFTKNEARVLKLNKIIYD